MQRQQHRKPAERLHRHRHQQQACRTTCKVQCLHDPQQQAPIHQLLLLMLLLVCSLLFLVEDRHCEVGLRRMYLHEVLVHP